VDRRVLSSSWEDRLREERLREDDFIIGGISIFDTVLKELWNETVKKYHYDVLLLDDSKGKGLIVDENLMGL
jgi:hypothetical protein